MLGQHLRSYSLYMSTKSFIKFFFIYDKREKNLKHEENKKQVKYIIK